MIVHAGVCAETVLLRSVALHIETARIVTIAMAKILFLFVCISFCILLFVSKVDVFWKQSTVAKGFLKIIFKLDEHVVYR